MKNSKILSLVFFLLPFMSNLNAQADFSTLKSCPGYPQDEACCLKNGGTWMPGENGNFCYLNLLASPVTKADCMNAEGYAYWRNDSVMLCIPKGILFVAGKVTQVNAEAKSITVTSDEHTYHIATDQMIPLQTGEEIEVLYTVDANGKMRGRSIYPMKRNVE